MSGYPARALYEAYIACREIGQACKPQVQDGVRRPALLHLPADGAGFKIALNANSLRPLVETIEESQMALQETHGLKNASVKTPEEQRAVAEKIADYNKAAAALMKQEVEWHSPAPVKIAQLGDRELSPEWLAALAAAGIVIGDPSPDDPPDKKG